MAEEFSNYYTKHTNSACESKTQEEECPPTEDTASEVNQSDPKRYAEVEEENFHLNDNH